MIAQASGIAISEALPGVEVQSDGDILKFIREAAVTIHHASATCMIHTFFTTLTGERILCTSSWRES